MEKYIKNEFETQKFAEKLAKELKPQDVVALIGDLGVGKTTLTKYIARELGIESLVNSPTYNIVTEYKEGKLPLYHFDAYRITSEEDLFERGIEEYFYKDGVSIVEWADLIAEILPENTKCIFMEKGKNKGERIYRCTF